LASIRNKECGDKVRKRVVILSSIISCILVCIGFIFYVIKSREPSQIEKERDYIFCQKLYKGMTIDEVRHVLLEFGEFHETFYDEYGFIVIMIKFNEKEINDRIGNAYVELFFQDNYGYTGPRLGMVLDNGVMCINGVSEKE
jgi:hypothetical protein